MCNVVDKVGVELILSGEFYIPLKEQSGPSGLAYNIAPYFVGSYYCLLQRRRFLFKFFSEKNNFPDFFEGRKNKPFANNIVFIMASFF